MVTKKNVLVALIVVVPWFASGSLFADQGSTVIPTETEIKEATDSQAIDPLETMTGSRHEIVIGAESRSRFSDAAYPWRAFGKIKFGKNSGWMCSGTLIGPRHIMTNSHCVDMKFPIYFYPSYNNGEYLHKTPMTTWATYVYWGTPTSDTSSGTHVLGQGFKKEGDWAILVLNEPIGNKFGWLGTKSWSDSWLNKNVWKNVAYPNAGELNKFGEYPLFQQGCAVRENRGDYLFHDCDSNQGASGSAIFGEWTGNNSVVALNNMQWGTGESCTPFKAGFCSNGAVTANRFISTLKKALHERP
jgi:protease YdgD